MLCVVITPVGPGHQGIFVNSEESVREAIDRGLGPFSEVIHLLSDDSSGLLGRSRARNQAVNEALRCGADWIFFLDADDVMLPTAFLAAVEYVQSYDGIWGKILEQRVGEEPLIRPKQEIVPETFEELINMDPFLTLQMGHFVRMKCAVCTPFDEELDAGEDFEYYLRMWRQYRCIKIAEPLFINRRGSHSTGPRSATGRLWREKVRELLHRARTST